MRKLFVVLVALGGCVIAQDSAYLTNVAERIFHQHRLQSVDCDELLETDSVEEFPASVCFRPRPPLDVYEAGGIVDARQGYAGLQNDPRLALIMNTGWTVANEENGYKAVADFGQDFFVMIAYHRGHLMIMAEPMPTDSRQ